MKVLLIEDEPEAASHLRRLLGDIKPGMTVEGPIDSVKSAITWFKSNPQPDLVFMDIQLADGSSFEIFNQVEVKAPVIFTTAFNEYALKAFKVNSIDYILKPPDKEEVAAAFRKYEVLTGVVGQARLLENIGNAMQMMTKKYKERFVIKVGEHLRSVEVGEIQFFYSLEKTTFAQTADNRKHVLDFTLEQLEDLLDPRLFFRINRKYIISMPAIRDMISYTNSRLKLVVKNCDDDDVIVARERVQLFKEWLDR
jgi:DNA-binding LytR/AlgR family response regulator